MENNHTTICIDGMSVEEEQIYLNTAWWVEGVVHVVISVVGLFANLISMVVSEPARRRSPAGPIWSGLGFEPGR